MQQSRFGLDLPLLPNVLEGLYGRSGSRPGLKVSKTRSDNLRSRPPFHVCGLFLSNDSFVSLMAHLAHTVNGEANIRFLLNDSLPTNYCFALSLVTRKQKESDEISSLLNNGKFIYLRHYLLDCTITSFQKKSETSHRRVRNRSLHCSPSRKGV